MLNDFNSFRNVRPRICGNLLCNVVLALRYRLAGLSAYGLKAYRRKFEHPTYSRYGVWHWGGVTANEL